MNFGASNTTGVGQGAGQGAGNRPLGQVLPAAAPAGGTGSAREADKAVLDGLARIAANVSHTLNNVLAVVCGNLAMIREASAEDREEMLDDAGHSMNRLDDLSRNLAAVSTLAPSQPVEFDVADFLERRLGQFGELIENAHTLALQIDAPGSRVLADPEYLALALNALVLNASEAMALPGTIRIACIGTLVPPLFPLRVPLQAGEQPESGAGEQGTYISITVTDGGKGVSDKALAHAFEPGFTTKAARGNVGFGLWFARTFAAAAGGSLWIAGNTPSGATMALALPACRGRVEPD